MRSPICAWAQWQGAWCRTDGGHTLVSVHVIATWMTRQNSPISTCPRKHSARGPCSWLKEIARGRTSTNPSKGTLTPTLTLTFTLALSLILSSFFFTSPLVRCNIVLGSRCRAVKARVTQILKQPRRRTLKYNTVD